MKKWKMLLMGVFLFVFAELGMWKGNELIRLLDEKTEVYRKELKYLNFNEKKAEEKDMDCPEELKELLENNPETEDFVKNYPNREKWEKEVRLTKEEQESQAPLFLQWDKRWGYFFYGDKMLAINGCGPTCLSMVLVGLKGDSSMNPKKVADYSAKNGYLTEDSGTQWSLMTDGAKDLGLAAEELALDENRMIAALETGHQIICSMRPGDFTTTGHFIVIYGREDGKFLVHDPNSRERSEKTWSYDEIEHQIKNLWKYGV